MPEPRRRRARADLSSSTSRASERPTPSERIQAMRSSSWLIGVGLQRQPLGNAGALSALMRLARIGFRRLGDGTRRVVDAVGHGLHRRSNVALALHEDGQNKLLDGLGLGLRIHEHPGGEGHVDPPPAPLEAFDAVPVAPAQAGLGDVVDVVGQDRHEQLVGVVGVADGQRDSHPPSVP